MPKTAMKAALAAATLLISSTVMAAEPNWYVSGAGGATWFESAGGQAGNTSLETSFDTGYAFLGAAGRQFGNGFRAEGEFGYRNAATDKTHVNSGPAFSAGGSMAALSFMANGDYDFDVGMKIKPYIGGIGFARVSANDICINGAQLVDDSDVVFAYQAIGGLGCDLSQKTNSFASCPPGSARRVFVHRALRRGICTECASGDRLRRIEEGGPMKTLLALVLALALAGCISKQDEVANAESACIAKGIMPSDPGFNSCMVDSDLKAQKEMGDEMDAQEVQDSAMMACCW